MKFVCMPRASFLFLSSRKKLQEAGIVDINCHSTIVVDHNCFIVSEIVL